MFAGLAAAIVPAISAGRQAPLAALSGRFTVAAGTARIRRPALVLLVLGIACTILGSSLIATAFAEAKRIPIEEGMYQATVTPTGPIALVLIGITSVIAALVWMLPSLVVKVAGIARVLPLSGRLALRDAARHRHRTGPATAAIMMAVAATAAVAFATSNAIAADAEDYRPAARLGDAVIRFDAGSSGSPPYSAGIVQKVAGLLPTQHSYEIGVVSLPSAKERGGYLPMLSTVPPPGTEGQINSQLLVVDPEYVARFEGFGPKAAAELRAGKIVLPQQKLLVGSTIKLSSDDDYDGKNGFSHAAIFVSTPPEVGQLRTAALISTEAARKLGNIKIIEAQYDLKRAPTGDELAAVSRLLGHDEALQVERGYESPARLWLIGVLGAATVVTLLGVAISVSLSAAEGRADLATLAAVGAPPRRRRNLAAAQAWVLGQLGCLLGVGVGALYGYTAHAAFGSPHFMVPWQEIGGIVDRRPVVRRTAGLVADPFAAADGQPDGLTLRCRILVASRHPACRLRHGRVRDRVQRRTGHAPLAAGAALVADQSFADGMGRRHPPAVPVELLSVVVMRPSCCNGIVHLNPYGADAVLLAVNLVTNPATTPAELADRCEESGVESRLVRDRRVTAADLTAVRVALDEWLAVVDAPDEEHPGASWLNAMLAKYTEHPRLTNHAGDGWHMHYRPDDVPVGRLVATLISTGTALHLAGRGISRLGRCATDGCDNVYADLSRGGRQRYCSPACANRDAVRRHRSKANWHAANRAPRMGV